MKYLVCLVIIVLIIGLCVCIYKEVTSSRMTVRDAGDLQRYKNRGLRRVGREPDIWHYPDGEIGLTLKYVINGREIYGVLDPDFAVSENQIRAIISAGVDVDVIVDPDDHTKFCLVREFYVPWYKKRRVSVRGQRSPWYGRSVVGYLVSWIAVLVVILALFLYSIYKH